MDNADGKNTEGEMTTYQYAKCEVCGTDTGCQYEVNGPEVFKPSNDFVRDHSRCISHPSPVAWGRGNSWD